ncbi:MAG: outer membrane protein assembly factor BamA [Rickettsiales bacterium]|nr:outer membrane protein assembly factor BamA [Rickettsiales bacterium]
MIFFIQNKFDMRGIKHLILLLITIFVMQFAHLGYAEDANVIKDIQIKGAKRTENSTIISYSELETGQVYSATIADAVLKKLYGTGFFANVSVSFDKGIVTIVVEENPIVGRISFKGNKSLKPENILPEISLQTRGYFSKNKLQSDVNRILGLYNKIGIFSVTVKPKISKLAQNRVNVLFEIYEGSKLKIEKISFIGNKRFSSNDLKQALVSKENRIFNIFRLNYYNADAIEYDKVLLKKFYNSKGYANFRTVSVSADIDPADMEKVYITFIIDEGAKYDFGKININNKISTIGTADLMQLVKIKSGKTFNGNAVEDANTRIIKYLAEKGFPFVKVDYEYKLKKEKKLVDVYYKVSRSPKVYIGKINISGNEKTYDYVVRSEFRLSEGDPYNGFLVDRSEQRVRNLNYFRKVTVTPVKTNKSDVVDLDVKVQEKSTASIKLAVGYSTSNGPMAMINFSEINWLGRGQKLSFGIQKTTFTLGANFGYSEPNFMGSEVEVGGGVGFSQQKNDTKGGLAGLASDHSQVPFNEDSYSANVFMNYDVTEYLNHNVDYSITSTKTSSSANSDIPEITQREVGKNIISAIGHTLTYNVADSAVKPTDGYIITLNQHLAGVGGDVKHLRHVLKGAYYYPIMEDLTLKIAAEGGYIHKMFGDDAVRISDNFYLGDFSFRGFDYAGLGPRDKGKRKMALGAVKYYKGSTELLFPFPGVSRDLDLSTSIFSDFGSAWDIDIPKNVNYTREDYFNKKTIRASAGVGFIWITRAGPLRIDFAHAFKKESFDETKLILFSYQTAL